jgi:hypothetical protein
LGSFEFEGWLEVYPSAAQCDGQGGSFGYSMATTDGHSTFLVGAPFHDAGGKKDSGVAYLVYKDTLVVRGPLLITDLDPSASVDRYDEFGYAMAAVIPTYPLPWAGQVYAVGAGGYMGGMARSS